MGAASQPGATLCGFRTGLLVLFAAFVSSYEPRSILASRGSLSRTRASTKSSVVVDRCYYWPVTLLPTSQPGGCGKPRTAWAPHPDHYRRTSRQARTAVYRALQPVTAGPTPTDSPSLTGGAVRGRLLFFRHAIGLADDPEIGLQLCLPPGIIPAQVPLQPTPALPHQVRGPIGQEKP